MSRGIFAAEMAKGGFSVGELFELRFDGPGDPSPKTLQRIKGIFIADFDFSVERAQRVLSETPTVVYSAESEELVTKYYELLKKAGAQVLIVRPETKPSSAAKIPLLISVGNCGFLLKNFSRLRSSSGKDSSFGWLLKPGAGD